jgi:aspartate-semialdehyde dehydrogenase
MLVKSDPQSARIPVGVLGATGSVGQRFVSLLAEHPWFELRAVAASERSVGRSYAEAARWTLPGAPPAAAANLEVLPADLPLDLPLVFSALDAAVAGPIERAQARAGSLVVTNARSHRLDPLVPLLVPEVNALHLELLARQSGDFGPGALIANPNCSTIGLCLALAPLQRAFGLRRVHVVTLQALSGAGLDGPSAFEMTDNLLPWIPGEEEKLERETRKILGSLEPEGLCEAELAISATCTRVNVLDGHTEAVSVELACPARAEELLAAWDAFRAEPQELALPSAPARPTLYLPQADAPQPRRHRELERGMAAVLGRLRPCPLLGWKFLLLSHNTLRGAAGGALLSAELAVARGALRGAPQRER